MNTQRRCRYCRNLFFIRRGHWCPRNRLGNKAPRVPKEPEDLTGLKKQLAETQAKLDRYTKALQKIATKEIWRGDPEAQATVIAQEALVEIEDK